MLLCWLSVLLQVTFLSASDGGIRQSVHAPHTHRHCTTNGRSTFNIIWQFCRKCSASKMKKKNRFFILLGYLLVSLNTILISSRWLWSFSLSSFSNRVTATYYSLTSYFTIFRILHASRLAKKEVLNFSDFVHLLRESSFFVQRNIFTYVCTFTGIRINALVIFMYSH